MPNKIKDSPVRSRSISESFKKLRKESNSFENLSKSPSQNKEVPLVKSPQRGKEKQVKQIKHKDPTESKRRISIIAKEI